jgi:hypothetical protein
MITVTDDNQAQRVQLDGRIDGFLPPRKIKGWALCDSQPSKPLEVIAVFEGIAQIGRAPVSSGRPDLVERGGENCGFEICLQQDITFADFHAGKITVEVFSADDCVGTLRVGVLLSGLAAADVALNTLSHFAKQYGTEKLSRLRTSGASASAILDTESIIEALLAIQRNKDFASQPAATAPPTADRLTPLMMPVGLRSPDQKNSVVLGLGGYGFIYQGANKLANMYNTTDRTDIARLAFAWVDLFKARKQRLAERSARYIQLIVPDKQSVLPDFYPEPLNTPTPHLAAIESTVSNERDLCDTYISAHRALTSADRLRTYRKLDSHTAPYGAFVLFGKIVSAMGITSPEAPAFTHEQVMLPDLGVHYFGIPFYDAYLEAEEPPFASARRVVKDVKPERLGNMGRCIVWQNPDAPIKKKVIAFANSFFSGGVIQGQLSWWMSRYCSEFHFIWSPSVDFDYVASVMPDFVICQTVERFLGKIPTT